MCGCLLLVATKLFGTTAGVLTLAIGSLLFPGAVVCNADPSPPREERDEKPSASANGTGAVADSRGAGR